MKKPHRNKSISSTTVPSTTDLDFFSSYSHEQVHIYDKLSSSISSICQIAYCTSEGIHICVPPTTIRSSTSSQNLTSTVSSMLITRIAYPFESTDQTNSISKNSSSYLFFERIQTHFLPNLYQAYKLRPTALSSFDRLLCFDTVQYKGFRRCLFSPCDITQTQGQSILATITSAHEVLIYEIISSSKRFFLSQSSNLMYDLTKILSTSEQLGNLLIDSDLEMNYRLLYFHLTSNILWDKRGRYLFQLQYSGHLILWKFEGLKILNEKSPVIIDTNISKPLSMVWNEDFQILMIIGKENQRVLINIDQMRIIPMIDKHENDYMNAEYTELIKFNETTLLLIEGKMNYCLIYTIFIDTNQVNPSFLFHLIASRYSSPYRINAMNKTIVVFHHPSLVSIHSIQIPFSSVVKMVRCIRYSSPVNYQILRLI